MQKISIGSPPFLIPSGKWKTNSKTIGKSLRIYVQLHRCRNGTESESLPHRKKCKKDDGEAHQGTGYAMRVGKEGIREKSAKQFGVLFA